MGLDIPPLDLRFRDHIRVTYWYISRILPRYIAFFVTGYLVVSAIRFSATGSAASFVPSHPLIVFVAVFLAYRFAVHPVLSLIWFRLSGRMAQTLRLSLTDEEFSWRPEYVRIGLPWRRIAKLIERRDGLYVLFTMRGGLRIPTRQLDRETIQALRNYLAIRIDAKAKR